MPDLPVHAQPTAERKPWRGRSPGADLCARDPARWSAMVRYEDQLVRDGWPVEDAGRIAWEYYVPKVALAPTVE